MTLYQMTIEDFCKQLEADVPVPGGGSASALSGEMGAALLGMVANMTARKAAKAETELDYEVAAVKVKASQAREQFNSLIERDSQAFTVVMDAFKLPKSNDDEKKIRTAAIQNAYKGAVLPPLNVAVLAYDLVDCGAILFYKGDKNALSDVCVGIQCLKTAFWGGVYNVKINLSAIKDNAFVDDITNRLAAMENDIEQKCHSIIGNVAF